MNRSTYLSMVLCALLVGLVAPGCSDHSHDDHAHDEHGHEDEHAHEGEHAHDDEHGHEDEHAHGDATEAVTVYGESTQLFVEFPALVRGEESAFAAHLTRLSDHRALEEGNVVVELSGGASPVEHFDVSEPSQAGIFRPVVKPAHVGPRQVSLHISAPGIDERHELGQFIAFSTRAGANNAASHEEHEDAISYLLEQQWKVPFGVVRADERAIRPTVPAFAQLQPASGASVEISAPRSGRVIATSSGALQIGANYEAGQTLLRLRSAPGDGADAATLDLAVDRAMIRRDRATLEVERLTPLAEQGVVPQSRLQDATSELDAARAELESARRRRSSLTQTQRIGGGADTLNIPSPIEGSLTALYVSPGAWVEQGAPLARIIAPDQLMVQVNTPQAYVDRLSEVSGVWFRPSPRAAVVELGSDALIAVGQEVDAESRTLPVYFRLDAGEHEGARLHAGMHVRAHLISGAPRPVTAVPVSSLVDDDGTDVVYVQLGGETFERRVVRLGERDGDWIEVEQGVEAGEWVVSRGAYAVKLASAGTETIGHGHAH